MENNRQRLMEEMMIQDGFSNEKPSHHIKESLMEFDNAFEVNEDEINKKKRNTNIEILLENKKYKDPKYKRKI